MYLFIDLNVKIVNSIDSFEKYNVHTRNAKLASAYNEVYGEISFLKRFSSFSDAPVKADGYSSSNTSDEHCAGGSSGGLIRLQANKVR